jgi:hypothetical protein
MTEILHGLVMAGPTIVGLASSNISPDPHTVIYHWNQVFPFGSDTSEDVERID